MKLVSIVILLACLAASSLASIERQSAVPVTRHNSGPSYLISDNKNTDTDNVSKAPLSGSEREGAPAEAGSGSSSNGAAGRDASDPDEPIGHLMIRRIYLLPMEPPRNQSPDLSSIFSSLGGGPGRLSSPMQSPDAPDAPRSPTFSLIRQHLFGADEASRNPSGVFQGSSSVERPKFDMPILPPQVNREAEEERKRESEREPAEDRMVMMDPMQLMLNMLHHAVSSAAAMRPPQAPGAPGASGAPVAAEGPLAFPSLFGDLNKEASANGGSELRPKAKQNSTNEAREDIVEIEGKKFLRKTVVNKHVGDNIVFMTRRLIFVPLNETETSSSGAGSDNVETGSSSDKNETGSGSTTSTTTTTTSTTTSTTAAPVLNNENERKQQPGAEPSSTSSPSSSTTTEAVSTAAAAASSSTTSEGPIVNNN